MPDIQVFNTLGRRKELFKPRKPGAVSMYSCGPTVYKYVHVGNFRSWLMADFWVRAFDYLGLDVTQVQNITDVGHLQDDTSERGEDKLVASAREEGKTPAEIAEFYTAAYRKEGEMLRIRPAHAYPRATDYIPQMIEAIETLQQKGLTYEVDGDVYYDVQKRPDYPKLSGNTLDQLQSGYRMEVDPRKHHPADFALWKAAGPRDLQVWDSPWGRGFPGWHIECTAMSLAFFPGGFDIHTGGVDNVFPHHEDEIAQSEPLLGGPMANYWIHGEFLTGEGGRKMAKSAGNITTISNLAERGYDPLAFRYLCLTARYRTKLAFTDEVLDGAQAGLAKVRRRVARLAPATAVTSAAGTSLRQRFEAALADDLDLPAVSAMIHEVLDAAIPDGEKRHLLEDWDRVLQVDIARDSEDAVTAVSDDAAALARARDAARAAKDYAEADRLRLELEALGLAVEDTAEGTRLRPFVG